MPLFIVKVLEQVGLQEVDEKSEVMPPGKPMVENETDWVFPPVLVAVMVVLTELPCTTEAMPLMALLDKE